MTPPDTFMVTLQLPLDIVKRYVGPGVVQLALEGAVFDPARSPLRQREAQKLFSDVISPELERAMRETDRLAQECLADPR